MSTESFHRHTRRRVDAATRHVFASIGRRSTVRATFARLRAIASSRSDLLRVLPPKRGRYLPLEALRNLAGVHRDFLREPESWPGATGHALCVVDSLARHLLGRYPGPRFLASVWFGGGSRPERERRAWFIRLARGESLRTLSLPITMTRRMRHLFLRTPDHLSLEHALRRAEVLGLGGDPALAAAVIATRLGHDFAHRAFWRAMLEWLVACGDALDLAQVQPIVDYVHATRATVRGRTYASVVHDAAIWRLAQARPSRSPPRQPLRWSPSRWAGLVSHDDGTSWCLVELLDAMQLSDEGRAMRHCVGSYAGRCARGDSTIWSLRCGDQSVLTIEVAPRAATIVQVRGVANARAVTGRPAELLRRWAARERLTFSETVRLDLGWP